MSRSARQPLDFRAWIRKWADERVVELAMIDALENLCRAELGRRRMLRAPPRRLGRLRANARWSEPGAVRELALDFAKDVLAPRMTRLRVLADQTPQLDGLIIHMIRNYLHDLQSQADRVGACCHKNVRRLLRDGALRTIDSAQTDPMGSVAFRPPRPDGDPRPSPPELIERHLSATEVWSALATRAGSEVSLEVAELFERALDSARSHGLGWLRPCALRDVVAAAARTQQAILSTPTGAPLPGPEHVIEALAFAQLEARLIEAVERSPYQRRKRDGMKRTVQVMAQMVREDDLPVTQAKVASRLSVSTSAVQTYIVALQSILTLELGCREVEA